MSEEESTRRLGQSIVGFLRNELTSPDLCLEHIDNLKLAIECLQSIYHLHDLNDNQRRPLLDMFIQLSNPVTIKDKLRAESLKEEGNTKMANGQYEEAEQDYSRAIELDKFNAIFYCNRAGARIKLQWYFEATSDCRKALNLNPDYAKAYERMGEAYTWMEAHRAAVRCFRQALELEPDNETYRNNLSTAEQQVAEENPADALMGRFMQEIISSVLGAGGRGIHGPSNPVISESQGRIGTESNNSSDPTQDENSLVSHDVNNESAEDSRNLEEGLISMTFIFEIQEEDGNDEVSTDNKNSMGQTDTVNDTRATTKESEELNYSNGIVSKTDDNPSHKSLSESNNDDDLTEIKEQTPSQELESKGTIKKKQNPDVDSNMVLSSSDDNPSDKSSGISKSEDVSVENKKHTPSQELENKGTSYKKEAPNADSIEVVSNSDDNPSNKSLDASKDEDVSAENKEHTPSQELENKGTNKNKLSEISQYFRNFGRSSSKTETDKSEDNNETKKENEFENTSEVSENKESNGKPEKTNGKQAK